MNDNNNNITLTPPGKNGSSTLRVTTPHRRKQRLQHGSQILDLMMMKTATNTTANNHKLNQTRLASLSLPILSAEPVAKPSSRKRKLVRTIPLMVLMTALGRILWHLYRFHHHGDSFLVGDHHHHPTMEWSRILDASQQKIQNQKQQQYRIHPNEEIAMDPWSLTDLTKYRSAQTQRVQQRYHRSRPPPFRQQNFDLLQRTETTITKPLPIQPDRHPVDWKTLCQNANLNQSSRVWITNILTVPTATAFALLISQQCQSEIIGADTLLPNLPSLRIQAMDRYRILLRSTKNHGRFQLLIPNQEEIWHSQINVFQPTHILHFDTNIDEHIDSWDLYMSKQSQRQYRMRHSLSNTQQILHYAKQQHKNNDTTVPTLLQVKTGTNDSLQRLLLESYHAQSSHQITFSTLQLPNRMYGPLISNPNDNDASFPNRTESPTSMTIPQGAMFVDDAMTAILITLQTTIQKVEVGDVKSLYHYNVSTNTYENTDNHDDSMIQENLQIMRAYHADVTQPYGDRSQSRNKRLLQATNAYRRAYGIHHTRLPCAASCTAASSTCHMSLWDSIIPISIQATRNCSFVVYQVDYDDKLENLVQPLPHVGPSEPPSFLCRVAFVSSQAPVVQSAMKAHLNNSTIKNIPYDPDALSQDFLKSMLKTKNGKIQFNGWTLIWIHDTKNMTDAEYSLPWMEPSRLFAASVNKAMFTSLPEFAQPPDAALLRIMSRINRPALLAHSIKEVRSGLPKISRWIERPPEPARSAALFGASPFDEPQNIPDFVRMAKRVGLEIPPLQTKFYQQAAHLISEDDRYRPEDEFSFVKAPFPFMWISMDLLVHDLRMDAARLLRCEWYNEILYWGEEHENRDAEELGLAWILGKRQIQGELGPRLDGEWYPLWQSSTTTASGQQSPIPLKNYRGMEIFLRIMPRIATTSAQQQ